MKAEINGVQIEPTAAQIEKVLASQNLKTKEERFKELIEGIDVSRPVVDFEKPKEIVFYFETFKR